MFEDFLRDSTNVSHAYYNIIIAGDLNCKLDSNCYESRYLREMVHSLSLHIVASEPTYHTTLTDSWLDLYVIDNINKQASFSKSKAPFIAGHDLLELTYAFDTGDARDCYLTRQLTGSSLMLNFARHSIASLRMPNSRTFRFGLMTRVRQSI